MIKKVVIIGPESTGKSSLSAALAAHYDTIWCREYAREYLLQNGTDYTFDTLLDIAKGQIQLEEIALKTVENEQKEFLFLDTDMYVMKVWCEYVFGQCHDFILEQINQRKYDFYLLANIDLPWTKDELREYPDEKPRQELFHIYKDILINQNVPWALVSGIGEEREQNAIRALDAHFGK